MKKLLLPFAVIAAIVAASSCSKKNDTPSTPQAQVMFINACVNADPVSVQVNSVNTSGSIAFQSNSAYASILAQDSVNFLFYANSTGTSIGSIMETLTANQHYSVIAAGANSAGFQPRLLFTSDDLTAPSAGFAKVRFVNAGGDSTAIQKVAVGSAVLDTNSTLGKITSFVNITADTTDIKIANAADFTKSITKSYGFQSGKIYTVVFTGSYSALATPPNYGLYAFVIQNN